MKQLFTSLLIFVIAVFSTQLNAQKYALMFDGTAESYLDAGQNDQFTPAEFTIETWVMYDDYTGGYIIANEGWNGETSESMGYSLRLAGNKQIELSLGIGPAPNWASCMTDTGIVTLGEWMHVAATFDGDLNATIYVNGEVAKTATLSGAPAVSNQNLSIAEGAMWKDRRLTGKLYQTRLWSVARTSEEIAATMYDEIGTATEGLVFEYYMGEGSGNTLADGTGNYDITIPESVTWFIRIPASVKDNNISYLHLYPNPVTTTMQVENNSPYNSDLRIYDIAGKQVYSEHLEAEQTKSLDLSELHDGVYLVKLQNSAGANVQKIIKR